MRVFRWAIRVGLPFLFAGAYLVASFILLFAYGGAGHGWGIGAWFQISTPVVLLSSRINELLPGYDLTVWVGLLGGVIQYGVLGLAIAWLLTRRWRWLINSGRKGQ